LSGWKQRAWTTSDGLPDNRILKLIQTRDGYLWVGTRFGVARFDGLTFLSFTRQVDPRLTGSPITGLVEDAAGNVWAGSLEGGLLAWDGRVMHVVAEESLAKRHDTALLGPSSRGGVLLAAKDRVERWRLGEAHALVGRDPLPDTCILPMTVPLVRDRSGIAWYACAGWLKSVDEATGRIEAFEVPNRRELEFITGLAVEQNGILVLVSYQHAGYGDCQQRFLRFQDGQWTELHRFPPGEQRCFWMMPSRRGGSWVANGPDGVAYLRLSDFALSPPIWSGGQDWPNCALEDRDGGVWVGTSAHGLFHNRELAFKSMAVALDADEANARAVSVSVDRVWMGSDGGVVRFQLAEAGKVPARFNTLNGLAHNGIRALAPDRHGRVWVGTSSGLSLIDDEAVISFKFPTVQIIDSDPQARTWNKIRCLLFDRREHLWVGLVGGLMRLGQSQGQVWCDNAGTSKTSDDTRALLEGNDGTIWIGSASAGLRYIPSSSLAVLAASDQPGLGDLAHWPPTLQRLNFEFPALTVRDGLSSDQVWALHEDAAGVVWAGTEHGLNRIRRNPGAANGFDIFSFTTRQGLPENLVNVVLEDDFGDLWIGHDRGIYRVAKADLEAVAAGRMAQVRCLPYDERDGLPSRETNGQISQPAGFKGPDGRLWFCTARGLAVVDPARVKSRPRAPTPVLEEVLVDDECVLGPGAHSPLSVPDPRIPPGRGRTLEFRWTAPSFDAPERLRFRYRMEGFDENWHEAGTRRTAFYSNLPPGPASFLIESLTHEGVRSRAMSFAFTIEPRLWQMTSFRLAMAGVVTLLVWGVFRWRIAQLQRVAKLERELALAQERKGFVRDLHDGLGGSLTSITLLAEDAKEAGPESDRLRRIASSSHDALHSLKDLLWASHAEDGSLEGLAAQLCNHAQRSAEAAGLECRFDVPLELPERRISSEVRRNLYFAFRETVTNTIRHAQASNLRMILRVDGDRVSVVVEDDGQGFDVHQKRDGTGPSRCGHGLANLQERMRAIAGSATIRSERGRGTHIEFSAPLQESPAS
jgi:signal transduction histidine kinase/ligand-binding sensor domain-containing protein